MLHQDASHKATYGELVEAAAKLPRPDPEKVELKDENDFQLIGHATPRVDIPSKVNGSAQFGIDVRVPGMLFAVVARCPTFGGKAAHFDAGKTKAIPGVLDVFEIPTLGADKFTAGGVVVVADSTWAAIKGRDALQISWDHGAAASESSDGMRQAFRDAAQKSGKRLRNDGDADAVLSNGVKKVEAVYELPFTGARRPWRPPVAGALPAGAHRPRRHPSDGRPQVALGPWAAVRITVVFLAVRGVVALVVGPVLGHVMPHFPLYLGIALCVEAGYALTRGRTAVTSALAAGALAGTAGLATEWGFSHLWGREPWQPEMLHGIWAASLVCVAAAVLGAALAGAVAWRRPLVPARLAALAGAGAVVLLGVPFPRNSAPVTVTVHTTAAGPAVPTLDRFGGASISQDIRVSVDVTPAATVHDPDFFWVKSWQGGGSLTAPLVETSPGHWVAGGVSPTGGTWKTILLLGKGSLVMAAPVAMPADPTYGQAAIPLRPVRTEPLVAASKVLMREAHGGAAWPADLAYSALALVTTGWLAILVIGAVSIGRSGGSPGRPSPTRGRGGLVGSGAAS